MVCCREPQPFPWYSRYTFLSIARLYLPDSLTVTYIYFSGQFFNQGTKIDKENRQLVLPKRSPIPVNLEDPKPEVHHKSQCWRPQTPGYQGEGLIEGDYMEYAVSSVFATDFTYSMTKL